MIPPTYTLTAEDIGEFIVLPERQRHLIHELLRACKEIAEAPKRVAGIAAAAAWLDLSPRTVRRKFDAYMVAGDWRVLVDRRREGRGRPAPLPAAFVAYWRELRAQHGSTTAAYRALIGRWACGTTIPGYLGNNMSRPRGWSYRNLQRHAVPEFIRMRQLPLKIGARVTVMSSNPDAVSGWKGPLFIGTPDGLLRIPRS